MSFELVDFTASSPFESLIQTLSYLIERRENKVDIHFQSHLLSLTWGGEDHVTEHLTGWKKDYYFILSVALPKNPLSIVYNRAASLKKQLLSASFISLSNLNLLDSVSFLVVAQKNSNSILFEGFTGGQPCIIESFNFMPASLVNLEGIEKLYHSRKVSKSSKVVYARINVSYDIHPIMPARFRFSSKNWIQASMSSKIARLETMVTLTIQSEFESRLIDYYYELDRIDPFAGSSVAALQFEKSTFASLKPMLSQITSLYYEFGNDAMTMPLDYIPGGFEGSGFVGNRIFLDQQEIIDALDYILTEEEEEDFSTSLPPAGLSVSVQQMLDCLRNQELTTSRNSLLWKFSKFLVECHCTSLHLNAKHPIIFQGLIKGVWKELLNHFQQYIADEKFLPNTLKSHVPIEHCLLDQKICLLNYCISRKKEDGQRNKEEDQFGRKNLLRTEPPLYEPFTQDQSPMTSDMLQEQQMAFEELAKSQQGRERLLNDQLVPLKSDIAAFKAANPACAFVDFISWHSPKDLLDGGVLSERFLNNGNVWEKCWNETIPAPIHKQKPLFDGERESAKALHYMENMSLQDLFLQLKPLLFILAYENLISQPCKEAFTPLVCSKINALAAKLSSGRYWADEDAVQEDILNLFEDCESALLLAEILIDNGLSVSMTDQLVAKSNVACAIPVEGEVFRIKRMLIGSDDEIPAPDKKVYALSSCSEFLSEREVLSFGVSQDSFRFFHKQGSHD